jgi:lipopolysaccharide/colanic/teichoic acid biosynthesis glycosyltransferase
VSAAGPVPADPRSLPARAVKRGFDVVGAAALLVVTAPLLGLACLAVRLETHGSPIYRQRRVGKDGRHFDLLKVRTMVSGAERMGAGLAVDQGDPRITRVGALVRRLSVDELPNLLNVLRGEMSLVGPRPTVQVQVSQYTERQLGRLSVPPGITGWAQVKGRAALPWHERIELDLWYIEHWSLGLDVRILAETARLLVSGKGLYRGPTGGWRPPPAR